MLAGAGLLTSGRVERVELRHSYRTHTSRIDHLDVRYSPDVPVGLPMRLFCKAALPGVHSEVAAGSVNELHFYRRVAPRMGRDYTVPCLIAECPNAGEAILLLEDLAPTHRPGAIAPPPSRSHWRAVLEHLAGLHGLWWQSEALAGDLVPPGPPPGTAGGPDAARANGTRLLRALGSRLTRDERGAYARALEWLPRLWPSFYERGPITLRFGDAHLGNFLWSRSGAAPRVRPCDWQSWQVGTPGYDLSSLIALQFGGTRRLGWEEPLLRYYHEVLLRGGATGYEWADLWLDYRLTLFRHAVVVPSWQRHVGLPASVWWPVLERGLCLLAELDGRRLADEAAEAPGAAAAPGISDSWRSACPRRS
jgi:hypothetical protein